MRIGIRKVATAPLIGYSPALSVGVGPCRVSSLPAPHTRLSQLNQALTAACISPFFTMSGTQPMQQVRACATASSKASISSKEAKEEAFFASLPTECRLPPISVLSDRVIRVMGLNPGPMTLGGTNTYLVGKGKKKVLVDTGDGLHSYIDSLKTLVAEDGIHVTAIILTHWHHDHVGGLREVLELFPDAQVIKGISKVMSNDRLVRDAWSVAAATHRGDAVTRTRVIADTLITPPEELPGRGVVALKKGSGLLQKSAALDRYATAHQLHHPPTTLSAAKLVVDPETTLLFIATPGHTDDHYSVLLQEENAIFTGDCVLGTGSSVFVCYSDFMSSLSSLERIAPSVLYPGHGPMVTDGVGRINEFIGHRLAREKQVALFLEKHSTSNPCTIMEIVQGVYTDAPVQMHLAAAGNVLHILKRMLDDKRVCLVDCTVLENPTPKALAEQVAYHEFLAEEEYHEVPDKGISSEGEVGSSMDFQKLSSYVNLLRWFPNPKEAGELS